MTRPALPHLLLAVSLSAAGCTTALSTMQPADTLPPGGVHVSAGMTVDLPVTRALDALDAAADAADAYARDPQYEPSEAEQRAYLEAAAGLALAAPGPTIDLMIRYGVVRHLDVGLRYTVTGVHLDGKVQLLDGGDGGWDTALSVGYVHHSYDGLVFDVLDYLRIDDYGRWDVEVPLIVGRDLGRTGKLWFGPKYVYSRISIDAALRNVDPTLTIDDSMHYVGGFGGVGLGFGGVYLFAELSAMWLHAEPTILGGPVELGGLIVVPAGGLMARF